MNLQQSFKENNSIRLGLNADSWQEAVKLAVQPLIDSGAVSSEYYDAIIASTEKYGPYYVLMPGMAMPHAEAGNGVFKDAFALITLTNPVVFSDGKEASVFITLAATDPAIHTTVAIPQIVALFELDNAIDRLLACQTPEEVLQLVEASKDSPYLEGLDLDS
ncbi:MULTISPECIES: PTS sugar transporter subunit IIA [Streptococcus]|uniref:PTS sugar transporter subunit IIA n=1 Tax=Streptococcus TaxID=1301 RepID=UPI000372CF6A|nr:PTS sugar transporter subunit IIA [Streptococcus thoraltensis]MDY4760828.1 PTS sugar transporter subunit IIA [Streptococcus thoraltensis]